MALFQFWWLRRLIRRHTTPIPLRKAADWKKRLSILYFLFAWNAFGMVVWQMYKGKTDWAAYHGLKSEEEIKLSPGRQFALQFQTENAKIVRVKGISKVSEDDFVLADHKNNVDQADDSVEVDHAEDDGK